jgi:hypothetical protein
MPQLFSVAAFRPGPKGTAGTWHRGCSWLLLLRSARRGHTQGALATFRWTRQEHLLTLCRLPAGRQLTYKLFTVTLDTRLAGAAPALVRLPLLFDPDESEKRELFMPPALVETLTQNDPKKARAYTANIRAFLGRFVSGGHIDNQDYMKSWKEDVFELRVQNQRPGERLRIFGAFGRPDTFVALFRKPRSSFSDMNDPEWDKAIYRVVDEWNAMFPGCRRVPSRPFSNCVTFNCTDVFA